MDLNKIKAVVLTREFIPIAAFLAVDLVLIIFAAYLGYTAYNKQQEMVQQQYVTEAMKSNADLVQANKSLLSERIEDYNRVLDQLIPDTETYFSVIAAFEQLGARTGVSVESYSINLTETTEEKLSLDLNIIGDLEAIATLLRDYHFVSGRFLTNEEVTLTFGEDVVIDFTVNLVHKPYVPQLGGVADITAITINQEDIAQMEKIIEETN